MHVLIIPSWYKTKASPLNGSFFYEQAYALNKNGIKVTVACVEFWGKKAIKSRRKEKYGFSYEVDNGIKTYRYMTYRLPNKFIVPGTSKIIGIPYVVELFIYWKLEVLLKKIIKEQGMPDIIHLHSNVLAGEGARKLCEKYNIKLVITEHSTGYSMNNLPKHTLKITDKNIKYCDEFIVVGNELYNYFSKKYINKRINVIPNMVNTEQFTIKNVTKSSDKFTFYSLAFLDSEAQVKKKGLDLLIEAFEKEFKNNENVELIIGGGGKGKALVEKWIDDKKISNIKLIGEVSREKGPDIMSKCDVFVLPSRFETFGVVFIEALSSGKPVIGTKGTGPEMFIDEINGLLVEKDNVNDLRNKMKYIYINNRNYNSVEIRENCINNFSENSVCKKIIDLYITLLKEK